LARVNDHYAKLAAGYLFPEIERRVRVFQERNPDAEIIRLGIGDVVLPLPASVREAMQRAVDELKRLATFTDLSQWVINLADPLFGFRRRNRAHHDCSLRETLWMRQQGLPGNSSQ